MTYDLSENIGKQLDYTTEKQLESGIYINATVTSKFIEKDDFIRKIDSRILSEIFCDYNTIQNEKNYEWIGISSSIHAEQPCCWVLSYEDYYTWEQYDNRNIKCGACEGFSYKTADFTIIKSSTSYDDCQMALIIMNQQTPKTLDKFDMTINVFYYIPKGYDGCILGFHNSSALTKQQIETGMSNPAASLGMIRKNDGDLYIRLK